MAVYRPKNWRKYRAAYAQAGLKLDTQHFITEEEIISGCQGAIAILATPEIPLLHAKLWKRYHN